MTIVEFFIKIKIINILFFLLVHNRKIKLKDISFG